MARRHRWITSSRRSRARRVTSCTRRRHTDPADRFCCAEAPVRVRPAGWSSVRLQGWRARCGALLTKNHRGVEQLRHRGRISWARRQGSGLPSAGPGGVGGRPQGQADGLPLQSDASGLVGETVGVGHGKHPGLSVSIGPRNLSSGGDGTQGHRAGSSLLTRSVRRYWWRSGSGPQRTTSFESGSGSRARTMVSGPFVGIEDRSQHSVAVT
jgi:hypothetical protein